MRISDWSSDVCSSDLRDRLGAARMHAAALGDQAGVVVGPRGARQLEHALALGEALRRIGCRVQEDVRSEERRVGKEGVSQCRSRGAPSPYTKKTQKETNTDNCDKKKTYSATMN